MLRLLLCLTLGLSFPAVPSLRAAAAATNLVELRRELHALVAAAGPPGAWWGVQVVSQRTGRTWFETNAAARFIPASNTKLFTGALALDRLGADHRFGTSLRTTAQLDANGVLKGDLTVVGGGDPTICARLHGGSWTAAFAPLVAAVRAAGIRRIEGDLVADEHGFRGPPFGSGWNWDDLAQYYGAAASALTAEDNALTIIVTPGTRPGDRVTARTEPLANWLPLDLAVVTGASNATPAIEVSRLPGEATLRVTGTVPAGGPAVTEEASVPSPAKWFGALFREALRRDGMEVTGGVRVIPAPPAGAPSGPAEPAGRELATVPSPPVGEVVREMMKPSQNLHAQLLLLGVGAETEQYPRDGESGGAPADTTEAAGVRALDRFLKAAGVAPADVQLEEGSGLSRKNLVTPRAVVQLLTHMSRHRWAEAWRTSLPVGGVDGTLRGRFTRPPTKGNVRAKTGTLRNVTSLSGYVTNAVGEPLVFSILVNNYVSPADGASARAEVDQLVERLAASRVRGE